MFVAVFSEMAVSSENARLLIFNPGCFRCRSKLPSSVGISIHGHHKYPFIEFADDSLGGNLVIFCAKTKIFNQESRCHYCVLGWTRFSDCLGYVETSMG